MFQNREEAAMQLARRLRARSLYNPLVLAIPRGGVVTGAVLARELGAELDVVLARKLRAPMQPELAIGAVSEDGQVYLHPSAGEIPGVTREYIEAERQRQLEEIARRSKLIRAIRPAADFKGRTVLVVDDGIATGSTMIAALQSLRAKQPRELLAVAPVAPPDRLAEVHRWCDAVVCLQAPANFWAIGQFYREFEQVDDAEVARLLREAVAPRQTGSHAPRS
jgi:putative phosphoribosyl transferase